MALLPVALVVLESALRIAGYGHRTGFFERIRVGSRNFLVNNEDFSLRFFPVQLARWPVPFMMEAGKPASTYRIFLFGESAAMGDPEPAYGPGRCLEALLRDRFPKANFEVVNLGTTAINSHTILPIARDCSQQQADLWIIYMGNNEMVGPYGAAAVFGPQSPPPLWAIRSQLALRRTRTGQWLSALAQKRGGSTAPASWGGMEMFLGNRLGPADWRKEIVYRHFQSNLEDILKAGKKSGARILLSTIAVNLKDSPPFASMTASNLSSGDRAACDTLFAEGISDETKQDWAAAADKFSRCAKLDPFRAELQFRWGDCLLRMTNFAAARGHFQLACDYDALPFRADSRINEIIRETGRKMSGSQLVLVDAVAALDTNSPVAVCGMESFYEHAHLNFDGVYCLARAWAERIEPLLPSAITNGATAAWASVETCERRLGLADWNRSFVVQSVLWRLQRPPFSTQINSASRKQIYEEQLTKLRQRMDAAAAVGTREFHERAIQLSPDDLQLRENFARFLEAIGDLDGATAQWQTVAERMPHNPIARYQAGRLLGMRHRWAEAEEYLVKALTLRDAMHEAWFHLGHAHAGEGKTELALQDYERAIKLQPLSSYLVFAGKTHSKLNRRTEAIADYRQAIQVDADCWEAHFAIGDELVAENKIADAQHEYEEVIRIQPANAMAHVNVGVAFARQNQFDAALAHFEDALRIEPANQMARVYRDRILASKNGGR